ncbi:MAG: multifunctional oxoglutarate decarboxylase/oxoglutarate dehydrogenase thiamine pyrophosphate-binding subunit/dihydrolipoyllysine-residue succinyltransferase subunit, partial [Acidobacteria bacterium]
MKCTGGLAQARGDKTLGEEHNRGDLSEIIAENFGANATYVEGLLQRYRSNPSLVDEAWRAYFTELLGESAPATSGNGAASVAQTTAQATEQATAQPQTTEQASQTAQQATNAEAGARSSTAVRQQTASQAPASQPRGEAQPIRGGALKIVENMETSLTVPTATSNRQVPVKVLEENRAIVNQFLKEHKRGKTSYTHFIAFAILRALERFPQMNDGFSVVEGQPARLRRAEVNLGLAIDLEKRDGTRTLLVPNIKNAGALNFTEFLAAYDDTVKRAREGKLGVPDFQDTTMSLT